MRYFLLYRLASVCWIVSGRTSETFDRLACWLEGRAEHIEERALIEAWADGVEVDA